MTLRTNGLNWLATNAGSGNCFASSGVSYRDGDGVYHTGGTKDVVNAFVVAHMTGNDSAQIIAGKSYTSFKSTNDGYDLSMVDVSEANDRQASGGSYPQYCTGTTPTPPPSPTCTPGARRCRNSTTIEQCNSSGTGWYDVQTCGTGYTCQNGSCVAGSTPTPTPTPTDKPVTGPMEVYVGGGSSCDPGTPSVTIDTSEAFAFFKATPYKYIGVGGIQVYNESSECRAYFAWEARVWDGYGYTTCPLTIPELQEITRYLAEAGSRPLSLTRLDASETDTVWGSFEVPDSMEGEKTLCLSLWGNYDYEALVNELNAEGYYDKI